MPKTSPEKLKIEQLYLKKKNIGGDTTLPETLPEKLEKKNFT